MSEEIWKDIEGYEELYQVSSWGRVKRLDGIDARNHRHKGRIMALCIVDKYYGVYLCKDGKRKTHLIHRLVARAFIPNPSNLPEVGHKDEKNLRNSGECNNKVENLEWVSSKENSNTPMRKQRISLKNQNNKRGNNAHAKIVICDNMIFECAKDCSEYYNLNYTQLSNWLTGARKMPQEWIDKGLRYLD